MADVALAFVDELEQPTDIRHVTVSAYWSDDESVRGATLFSDSDDPAKTLSAIFFFAPLRWKYSRFGCGVARCALRGETVLTIMAANSTVSMLIANEDADLSALRRQIYGNGKFHAR